MDERRIAMGVAIGLPLVTLSAAAVVGILLGPATSILVIAAGLLLGVIAIFWASLRVLTGDAPLPPELEMLEMASQGVDGLATRKKMLLRALKDLENERGIGKIEEEDYEAVASTYRAELKAVLKQMDAALDPHRGRAEEAVRAHLVKVGLVSPGYRGAPPPPESDREVDDASAKKTAKTTAQPRLTCPKCGESNEPDAKFCKECATKLSAKDAATQTRSLDATDDEDDGDDDDSEDSDAKVGASARAKKSEEQDEDASS